MDKISNIKSKETTEQESRIQAVAEELKNTEVSLESYSKFHNKIMGMMDQAISHVEQYELQYLDSRQPFIQYSESEQGKEDYRKKTVVPYDAFYSLYESVKKAQSMISLLTNIAYLNDIYRAKVEPILAEVNSLQVRSDALKEIKEESKTNRDWTKEMVTTQMESMRTTIQSQLNSLRSEMQSNINQRFGEMVDVFRIALSKNPSELREFDKTLQETKKSFTAPQLSSPPKPVKKPVVEDDDIDLSPPNPKKDIKEDTDEEEQITPKVSGKPPRPTFEDNFGL